MENKTTWIQSWVERMAIAMTRVADALALEKAALERIPDETEEVDGRGNGVEP